MGTADRAASPRRPWTLYGGAWTSCRAVAASPALSTLKRAASGSHNEALSAVHVQLLQRLQTAGIFHEEAGRVQLVDLGGRPAPGSSSRSWSVVEAALRSAPVPCCHAGVLMSFISFSFVN